MSHCRTEDVGVNGTTLLGTDSWLVFSTPGGATTADGIDATGDEPMTWVLIPEREGRILLSGPLVAGPATPGRDPASPRFGPPTRTP